MTLTVPHDELITLISERDEKGYEVLYREYSGILYGIIITIVKDTASANTVLAQTLTNVTNKIKEYQQENVSFITWLSQLARKEGITYQQSMVIPAGAKLANIDLVLIEGNNNEHSEKEIFKMMMQGYKSEEIAKKLNITTECVRTNIRKAIRTKSA